MFLLVLLQMDKLIGAISCRDLDKKLVLPRAELLAQIRNMVQNKVPGLVSTENN